MTRDLTIYFTSDTHGYFSPVDYATGEHMPTGVINCSENFTQDGNALIIDGGDTIQGSPFTYYLHKNTKLGGNIPAKIMNACGYQFVTLGNHDFNYGLQNLRDYLSELHATCLCANVDGLDYVEKTAVVTLTNGVRVGLTGATTCFIPVWEKPENLEGITISDPLLALEEAFQDLKKQDVDLTICIYHGGYEADLKTGELLSDTKENQAYEICRTIPFDIILTGHQHIPMEDMRVFDTYTCQTADKAKHFVKMDVSIDDSISTLKNGVETGKVTARSMLCPAGNKTSKEIYAIVEELEEKVANWLDTPTGHLDCELKPEEHIKMAEYSLIANFFNQVQLDASGADLSCTSLGNEVKGFSKDVTIRDVVATYIYPNTLQTLAVNRYVLKSVLERCASYFDYDESGSLCVNEAFLKPKVEHYNYDYFSGIDVTYDLKKPIGERVTSIQYKGKELDEERVLTLCMNNYRSTGTGGYDAYKECERVKNQSTEIVEMIMDYISSHEQIQVDAHSYLTILK